LFPEKKNQQVEKTVIFQYSWNKNGMRNALPDMLILWIILSSIIFLAFCDYRLY